MVAKFKLFNPKTRLTQNSTTQILRLKSGKVFKLAYGRLKEDKTLELCNHIGLFDADAQPLYEKETVVFNSQQHTITMKNGAYGLILGHGTFYPFFDSIFIKDGACISNIAKDTSKTTKQRKEVELLHF